MLTSVNQSLAVLDNEQPYSDGDTIQRSIDSVSAKASTLTNQSRADDVRLADVINSTKGEFLHFNLSKTNSIFRRMFISVINVLVKFRFYLIIFMCFYLNIAAGQWPVIVEVFNQSRVLAEALSGHLATIQTLEDNMATSVSSVERDQTYLREMERIADRLQQQITGA